MKTKHTLVMRHDKDGNVRPEAMAEHTPGPWKYTDKEGREGRIYGNVEGGPVAIIEYMNNYGGTDADRANGVLIAAAPEMLTTLRDIDRMFEKQWTPATYSSWQAVKRMIAKATNETL